MGILVHPPLPFVVTPTESIGAGVSAEMSIPPLEEALGIMGRGLEERADLRQVASRFATDCPAFLAGRERGNFSTHTASHDLQPPSFKSAMATEGVGPVASSPLVLRNARLQHCLAILEREGIKDAITQNVLNRPRCFAEQGESIFKQFVLEVLSQTLPANFLMQYKSRILAGVATPPSIPDDLLLDGVFHILSDKRLQSILRGGGIKHLDDNPFGPASVGELEMQLGLRGLFCTFQNIYAPQLLTDVAGGEPSDNVLVFKSDILQAPGTICLEGEFSFSVTFYSAVGEGNDIIPDLYLEARGLERLSGKRIKKMNRKDIADYIVHTIACAMSGVLHPNELMLDSAQKGVEPELVVNDVGTLTPQMIIVEEEPEYYMDTQNAYPSPVSNVPIVTKEAIRQAVDKMVGGKPDWANEMDHFQKLLREVDSGTTREEAIEALCKMMRERPDLATEINSDRKYIQEFVRGVNRGAIDLDEYRAR